MKCPPNLFGSAGFHPSFHSRIFSSIRIRIILSLCGALLLLTGCSGGSDPAGPQDVTPWWVPLYRVELAVRRDRAVARDSIIVRDRVWAKFQHIDSGGMLDAGIVRVNGGELLKSYRESRSVDRGYYYEGDWKGDVASPLRFDGSPLIFSGSGTEGTPPFADTMDVRAGEPIITYPGPSDTVSLSSGFRMTWDTARGLAEVAITFITPDGEIVIREGVFRDTGSAWFSPDMLEGLEPGRLLVRVDRYYTWKDRSEEQRRNRLGTVTISSTVELALGP